MYQIIISRSAEKALDKVPARVLKRLVKAIDRLGEDPRPSGSRKLKGSEENLWRTHIEEYRVIYTIADKIRIADVRLKRNLRKVHEPVPSLPLQPSKAGSIQPAAIE